MLAALIVVIVESLFPYCCYCWVAVRSRYCDLPWAHTISMCVVRHCIELVWAHKKSQSRLLTQDPSSWTRRGEYVHVQNGRDRPLATKWSRIVAYGVCTFTGVIERYTRKSRNQPRALGPNARAHGTIRLLLLRGTLVCLVLLRGVIVVIVEVLTITTIDRS